MTAKPKAPEPSVASRLEVEIAIERAREVLVRLEGLSGILTSPETLAGLDVAGRRLRGAAIMTERLIGAAVEANKADRGKAQAGLEKWLRGGVAAWTESWTEMQARFLLSTVANYPSIRRAATALDVPPSTLSDQVRRAKAVLGEEPDQ